MEIFSNKKKILIYPHSEFSEHDGGITVQYFLCKLLKDKNFDVKIFSKNSISNNIFSEYTTTFDNDNTIVLYCEGIDGNPLNAKHVVRWILSELGKNVPSDRYLSWGKDDLCYYFLSENKIKENPDKVGSIYKILTTIYLKPNTFINQRRPNRNGYCHIFRKSSYHKNLVPFHPPDSFDIAGNFKTYEDMVEFFNTYNYFICYDPASFLPWIAGLCGCIPILHKVENVSKEQFFTGNGDTNSLLYTYYQTHPYSDYPGIAYGMEELDNAKNTIDLLPDVLMKQIEYTNNTCVNSFIEDIEHFEENKNTMANNF